MNDIARKASEALRYVLSPFENYSDDAAKGGSMTEYVFYTPPKYVGAYRIGGTGGLHINFTKKPNWFHRYMMRMCLGWEWVDA